ncbi:TrkA family potassium uptake protein [Streptomyces sp. B6B3]|uniref:potassium channel family protein n=1 Tax=Streptomyces sp. B6B3 TaxID=3153570 RepID=UPI00325E5363
MRAVVVGGGRLGAQVAQALAAAGHEVALVEVDEDRLTVLGRHVPARLVPGDACDPAVLEAAGLLGADLMVAATGSDETNLVVSLLAKRRFAVPRVAARVDDAENAWLFDRSWGVDIVVPSAMPLVSLIEEAVGASDTVALLRLGRAGVSVIETVIASESRGAGRTLGEIPLPDGTVVATVVRDGQPTPPLPGLRLLPGDEVLVVSHASTEREIDEAFH